jgi:hypothetical protein
VLLELGLSKLPTNRLPTNFQLTFDRFRLLTKPTLPTNLSLFHISTLSTLTLLTAIQFEMRNKIKFDRISLLINQFYRLCRFRMRKLKFSTEIDFIDRCSALVWMMSLICIEWIIFFVFFQINIIFKIIIKLKFNNNLPQI